MKKDKYARIKSEEEIREIAYKDGSEFIIDPCVITKEMFEYCGEVYKIVQYE